jgi:hypothetical protein
MIAYFTFYSRDTDMQDKCFRRTDTPTGVVVALVPMPVLAPSL